MSRTVLGGSIAALVAADALAAAGEAVTLLLPRKNVGGGFMPLVLDGHRLERGLRALELHYEGAGTPPPLRTYNPAGDGHRPHVRRIDTWVRELVGDAVVELDRPQMWLGGRLGDEVLITCDLTHLPEHLTPAQAEAIRSELRDPPPAHDPWATSTTAASLAQHGATLHALLVEPFARKLSPAGGDDVPAALRRKLWLALFRPRTVDEALRGGPIAFRPERPLHGVHGEGTGALVTALLARLEAAPGVTVERVDGVQRLAVEGRDVRVTCAGRAPLLARDPILALSPGELFGAAGVAYEPDRVTSAMAWLRVREPDVRTLPSFVHVVDADVPAYRVARGEQRDGHVTVCVELAHDVAKDDALLVAQDVLRRLGLVGEDAAPASLAAFRGPTFTAPTFANLARFTAARAAYDALGLPARTIGGSEAFGADSFNEQVLQGLAAAEALAPSSAVAA